MMDSDSRALDRLGAVALLLITAIILLRAPLTGSLWLDETVTAWVISGSLSDAFSRAAEFQAQSPLYFTMAWVWRSLFGANEFALRSLSLLITAGTFFALYRLAGLIRVRESIPFVLFPFLCLEEVTRASFGARPYALGLMAIVWSVLELERWRQGGSSWSLVRYVLACVLVFYSHYLFAMVGVVHLSMLLLSERPRSTRPLLLAWVVLALLCVPGLVHLRFWAGKAESIRFSYIPTVSDLFRGIVPRHLAVYLLCALGFARIHHRVTLGVFPRATTVTSLIWWIAPPLLLWCAAHLTGSTLFIDRYYLWRAGGIALLVGLCMNALEPARARRLILIVWCFFAAFLELSRQWHVEDWRGAATLLRESSASHPVLVYSGLIEADAADWERGSTREEYLLSPLIVYPVPQPLIPIPSHFEHDAGKRYFDTRIRHQLSDASRVLLVAQLGPRVKVGERVVFVHEYVATRLAELGFTFQEEQRRGLVGIAEFVRSR